MKVTGIIVLILVIFAAAVLAEVWRELHCFKITRYRIRTSKIKGDAGKVRIAFLSDLHNHVYGKENEELLLAIRAWTSTRRGRVPSMRQVMQVPEISFFWM